MTTSHHEGAEPIVELRDVEKSYRMGEVVVPVLRGASLRIWPGESVVLFGPSGSGKTTLLNIVAAIDSPDSGIARAAGVDLVAATEEARTRYRRERMGYVFQFYNLIPTLTALENVALPLELNGRKDFGAAREALERVGMANKGNRFPSRLSGGEQQRVAIARALVKEPSILLGDEPTGNLDRANAREIVALLGRLNASGALTLLLATHDPALASSASRVVRLEDGKILEGEPNRVVTSA